MQEARIARLALRDIRIQADKTRKALKEESLRYGKAVQGVYNVIEYLITPIEKHLEEREIALSSKEKSAMMGLWKHPLGGSATCPAFSSRTYSANLKSVNNRPRRRGICWNGAEYWL